MAVTAAQLQQLYLAYFGRPADFDGIVFYTTGNWDIWQVARAFGESPESQALYGPGFNASVINAIYHNLFNRDAEPAGLLYWSQQVASGALTPGEAALGILLGAQNADAVSVANKLTVAAAFTAELDTATEILAYTGDAAAAAARAFLATVTFDPATVTAAEANLDATIADIVDVGGITGVTVALTADPDTFASANQTYIDTVNGIIDQTAGKSTFSDSDKITGNGHTVVNVTVKDAAGGAPVVTMSDIAHLNILNAGATTATFDATGWTNVSQIALAGSDGLTVTVDDLTNDTGLKLKIDATTDGTIVIPGANAATVAGMTLAGTVFNNGTADATGAVASFGTTGVDVTLGASDTAAFSYYQSKVGAAGAAATLGSITLDHVNINVGTSGNADTITIYSLATSNKGAATVGSVSLGNVSVNVGTSADAYLYVYNEANSVNAGKESATAGDMTVFWTNMVAASGAEASVYLENYAFSHKGGSATVGNMSLGGLSMSGTGYGYYYVSNEAVANTTGAAKAGNLSIGNITLHATSGTNDHSAYLYNYAFADKGAATVGNVSVGDIDSVAGYYNYLSISNYATNNLTGAVTAGTFTVGNINMEATGTGSNYFTFYNSAVANGGKGGAATVGDVSLGNLSMSVASSSNYLYMYEVARNSGTGGAPATLGNFTLGTVTMNQVAATGGSTNYLYIDRTANNAVGTATAGNVSIGDVNINVPGITQAGAENFIVVYNDANAGASGLATVGTLTIGNVTARTGIDGEVWVYLSNQADGGTDGSTGRVTVGNVAMTGSKSASMYLTAYNYMYTTGSVGGISVGNVTMKGDTTTGTAEVNLSNWASNGDSAGVTVGNVNLTAKNLGLYITNSAQFSGNAGAMVVGNVTMKGGTYSGNNQIFNFGADSAGTLTVGNVSLTSIKADNVNLHITNSSTGGAAGTLTVGDLSVTLNDSDTNAAVGASAVLQLFTDTGKSSGGNIVAGNITAGVSGITTSGAITAAMDASVSISSTDGTVTVGNITVTSGGFAGKNVANVDNLGDLSAWFTASGSTVTIGNVDYSGYSGATTIDVSDYAGAASIKGGKGANTIVDNKATNSVDLSANTTKGDTVYFLNAQSAVKDTGTAGVGGGTVTASQTAVDVITGWAASDKLSLWDNTGNAPDAIDGDGDVIQNTPSQTYAQFLLNAEIQITQSNNSAYVAVIGGNTYIALNNNGKVAEIVEITGSHTFDGLVNPGYLTFLS